MDGILVGPGDVEAAATAGLVHTALSLMASTMFFRAPEADQPDVLQYVRAGCNVVVLRTFSKAYGLAGLRVGYAVSRPEVAGLLNRVRQPFNVNSIAQAAAVAALDDHTHLEVSVQTNLEGLQQLAAGFERLEEEPPYGRECTSFGTAVDLTLVPHGGVAVHCRFLSD